MQRLRWLLLLIVILVIGAGLVLYRLPLQLGLDLRGGAQLTIEVQPTEEIKTITDESLIAVKTVIENRVNALGVSEPLVQTAGENQVVVQLPGVTDPGQAERILGGTAQLEFQQQKPGTEGDFQAEYSIKRQIDAEIAALRQAGSTPDNVEQIQTLLGDRQESNQALLNLFEPVGLTGKMLDDARPSPNQAGTGWEVALRFDEEGGKKFAELTQAVAGTGRSLGIFLDDNLISAPVVGVEFANTGITG
ncbi:MAG: protein translocase subunit SecD, partial [Synechocystis sp.]|nr:protein translocase subunit SecD [Synechocystis sp.]